MERLSHVIALVPDWLAGVGVLFLAWVVALFLYAAATKTVMALTARDGSFARSLFYRVKRLIGLAFVLVASSLAVQLPYFSESFAAVTAKLVGVAVIGLAGWGAIVALDIASSLYLRQFDIETADNLLARKHSTQIGVLRRAVDVLIVLITVGVALMSFESVRQFGVSLFASAGAAGLVVGFAARPVLSNLIAGIQLAITQPIRIQDAVIVEGEWGWIDEITSTYVVVKLWDWRRLIVPLSYFMEKPFQNWTRETGEIIGSVYISVDYEVPVDPVRAKLEEIVQASDLWNGKVVNLQVTDFKDTSVQLRMLVSADTSPEAWDLRCEVREKILKFLQEDLRPAFPRYRLDVAETLAPQQDEAAPAPAPSRAPTRVPTRAPMRTPTSMPGR